WTGSAMIVWGGFNGSVNFNDGAIYNPMANSWTTVTAAGAPSARDYHTAVWTGSSMIVWGGYGSSALNNGGIYVPTLNSWTAVTTTNAPSARYQHTAVWISGAASGMIGMIVWGGYNGSI